MKRHLFQKILLLWACLYFTLPQSIGQVYSGPYLGQTPPGTTPVKFAPNFISSSAHEFSCSFTPDGKEFYFTRRDPSTSKNYVMVTTMRDSSWIPPQKAPFTGVNQSFEATVTSVGTKIYFMMSDPGFYNGSWSIFYVTKTGNSWSDPRDAGVLFNPMKTMFVTTDLIGTLYTTDVARGPGNERIITASPDNGSYTRFSILPDPINTNTKDMYPCISRDGKILIFNSSRSGNSGKSGLFVSHWTGEGTWGEPIELDLGMQAGLPYLTYDGKYLFFTAGASQASDIYWVSADILGSGTSGSYGIRKGSAFDFDQNFPNPCSDHTQIPVTLYEPGEVEICLYTTTGLLLETVFRKFLDPGHFNIPVNVASYDVGTYVFKAWFNGKSVGDKVMIIIR